jgi:hypothetical protein
MEDGETQAIIIASDLIDIFPNLINVQLFTDNDTAINNLKDHFISE